MTDAPTIADATRPDAAVMRGVIPYLGYDGRAAEAATFYARAFAARDLGRYPDEQNPGRYLHIQLEINGGAFMMTDCRAPWQTGPTVHSGSHGTLVVSDGEAWWHRAVEAGCEVLVPFERQFWGDRWGMLRDPFGVAWAIDEPA